MKPRREQAPPVHLSNDLLKLARGNPLLLREVLRAIGALMDILYLAAAESCGVDPVDVTDKVEGRIEIMTIDGCDTIGRVTSRDGAGKRGRRTIDVLGNALGRPDPGAAMASYLEAVVYNAARDVRRTGNARRKRLQGGAGDFFRRGRGPMPDDGWITRAWPLLTPLEQQVVRLYLLEQKKQPAVAAALGLTRDQVQGVLEAARARLRQAFPAPV